jgi:hypothetical protein
MDSHGVFAREGADEEEEREEEEESAEPFGEWLCRTRDALCPLTSYDAASRSNRLLVTVCRSRPSLLATLKGMQPSAFKSLLMFAPLQTVAESDGCIPDRSTLQASTGITQRIALDLIFEFLDPPTALQDLSMQSVYDDHMLDWLLTGFPATFTLTRYAQALPRSVLVVDVDTPLFPPLAADAAKLIAEWLFVPLSAVSSPSASLLPATSSELPLFAMVVARSRDSQFARSLQAELSAVRTGGKPAYQTQVFDSAIAVTRVVVSPPAPAPAASSASASSTTASASATSSSASKRVVSVGHFGERWLPQAASRQQLHTVFSWRLKSGAQLEMYQRVLQLFGSQLFGCPNATSAMQREFFRVMDREYNASDKQWDDERVYTHMRQFFHNQIVPGAEYQSMHGTKVLPVCSLFDL